MGVLFLAVFAIAFYYIRADLLRFPVGARQENFVHALLMTAGMYATNLLVTIVTVLISVSTLSGEIESHVIDAIVTKPIPRWQIVAGKWLAYAIMAISYLLFLAGGLMLIVYLQSGYHFENISGGLLMMAACAHRCDSSSRASAMMSSPMNNTSSPAACARPLLRAAPGPAFA